MTCGVQGGVAQDLRHWVNAGLMTFFFFVVGLEARREPDLGAFRERLRIGLPFAAACGGMLVPIALFLAINAGRPSAHGWGAAAEAPEAAADQGAFWPMYDLLLTHQDRLGPADLVAHAGALGLDVERFEEDLLRRSGAGRVEEDLESAGLSGVSGTPTFFINGVRHYGAYDIDTLTAAVRAAALAGGRGT